MDYRFPSEQYFIDRIQLDPDGMTIERLLDLVHRDDITYDDINNLKNFYVFYPNEIIEPLREEGEEELIGSQLTNNWPLGPRLKECMSKVEAHVESVGGRAVFLEFWFYLFVFTTIELPDTMLSKLMFGLNYTRINDFDLAEIAHLDSL